MSATTCPYIGRTCLGEVCSLWDAEGNGGSGCCCHLEDVRIRRALLTGAVTAPVPPEVRVERALNEIMAAACKHGLDPNMIRDAIMAFHKESDQ